MRWTIGRKLIGGFMGVALITALIGGVGFYAISKTTEGLEDVAEISLPAVDSLLVIDGAIIQVRAAIRTLGISGLEVERRQRQVQILLDARNTIFKTIEAYEKLPQQTNEAAKEWQEFTSVYKTVIQENDKVIELGKQFDALGIADPADFRANIEQLTKDHHSLALDIMHLIYLDAPMFERGNDHTTCNAGRFFSTFTTNNLELQQELRNFQEPHRRFHESVRQIKNQVTTRQFEQARLTYQRQMQPAVQEVIGSFERMLTIAKQAEVAQERMIDIMMGSAAEAQNRAQAAIAKTAAFNRQLAEKNSQDAITQALFEEKLVLIFSFIAVIVAIFLGLFITRKITVPVNDLVSLMVQVREKQVFDARVAIKTDDEIGDAGNAFNGMLAAVESVMNDINQVMAVAAQGQFNDRVSAEARGDLEQLKKGLNESLGAIQRAIDDTSMVATALAAGNLDVRIEANHPGQFGELKVALNGTMDALDNIFQDIGRVMHSAASGQFNERVEASANGAMDRLKTQLNASLAVIQRAINDVAMVANSLADGDLTVRVVDNHPGQFGELKDALNTTMDRMTEIVSTIMESAEVVKNASDEMASGNADMSKRAEEQASSLEETASSMEELTGAVQQNAENASRANQLAITTRGTAETGGKVVNQAVTAMGEINDSSNKIYDIIGVIDEIAFQTNLLALNASVEAARAGEQGRGFAVVATEVRNLAQRSATAAREIKELIQDSVSKVSMGSELVGKSGETLQEIVEGVKRVGDIIAEIAAASKQQTSGIEQVNQAVAQMDDITQRNAALAEEASANSENLNAQAVSMAEQMGFFKIETSSSSHGKSSSYRSQAAKASASSKPQAVNKVERKVSKPSDDEWEEF